MAGQRDNLASIGEFLRAESAAHRPWAPAGNHILRALTQPLNDVRVVIVGQDPYPTPGHAVGLSFSVAPDVRPIPRSLTNIYTELTADLGVAAPSSGDLTPWTTQGVLLLNRVLTVQQGQPGSHRGHGWEEFTEAAITAIAARPDQPVVAILWGKDAQTASGLFDDAPVIASPTPARCPPIVDSSDRDPSVARTRCSKTSEPNRSIGRFRRRLVAGRALPRTREATANLRSARLGRGRGSVRTCVVDSRRRNS